jgi:hypothetical protein
MVLFLRNAMQLLVTARCTCKGYCFNWFVPSACFSFILLDDTRWSRDRCADLCQPLVPSFNVPPPAQLLGPGVSSEQLGMVTYSCLKLHQKVTRTHLQSCRSDLAGSIIPKARSGSHRSTQVCLETLVYHYEAFIHDLRCPGGSLCRCRGQCSRNWRGSSRRHSSAWRQRH